MNDTSGPRFSVQPTPQSVSLIDHESFFSGTYRTPHDMRIEGRYEGDIDCRGTVFVGDTATVTARVTAGNVIVAGQFEGEIACETRFEVLPTGRVTASVVSSVTVVHEGAFYQGDLHMARPGAERPLRPPAAAPGNPLTAPARTEPSPAAGAERRPGAAAADTGAGRRPPAAAVARTEADRPASLLATAGRTNGSANAPVPETDTKP